MCQALDEIFSSTMTLDVPQKPYGGRLIIISLQNWGLRDEVPCPRVTLHMPQIQRDTGILLVYCLLFIFEDRVLLCSQGWTRTHYLI